VDLDEEVSGKGILIGEAAGRCVQGQCGRCERIEWRFVCAAAKLAVREVPLLGEIFTAIGRCREMFLGRRAVPLALLIALATSAGFGVRGGGKSSSLRGVP
jgi:hypothetical protein